MEKRGESRSSLGSAIGENGYDTDFPPLPSKVNLYLEILKKSPLRVIKSNFDLTINPNLLVKVTLDDPTEFSDKPDDDDDYDSGLFLLKRTILMLVILVDRPMEDKICLVEHILSNPKTDPNILGFPSDGYLANETALTMAAGRGYLTIVKILLAHPKTDPNVWDHDMTTYAQSTLEKAIRNGHALVVKELLKHSITDPNIVSFPYDDVHPTPVLCLAGEEILEIFFSCEKTNRDIDSIFGNPNELDKENRDWGLRQHDRDSLFIPSLAHQVLKRVRKRERRLLLLFLFKKWRGLPGLCQELIDKFYIR